VLAVPRNGAALAKDVTDMRARLRAHQPQRGPFDIRRGDGGLVDIEFIAQMLQLAHATSDAQLIGARDTGRLLDDLHAAGYLSDSAHADLSAAAQAYLALRQIASLCLEDNETAPAPATAALLLETLNEPDMARLHDNLQRHRAATVAALKAALEAVTQMPENTAGN
jgi:glutamate-ammonia-ligase adenylyltransferase